MDGDGRWVTDRDVRRGAAVTSFTYRTLTRDVTQLAAERARLLTRVAEIDAFLATESKASQL